MGTQHRDVIEINGKKYDAVTGRMIKEEHTSQTSTAAAQTVTVTAARPAGAVLDGFTRRSPVKHTKQVQKSQTLMRNAVKKPVAHSKPVATSASPIHKPTAAPSVHRQQVAATTAKSPLVSKYGSNHAKSSVVKKVTALPVKHPVAHHVAQTPQHAPTPAVQSHKNRQASALAVHKALAHASAHEQPAHHVQKRTKHRKLAHKLGITPRAMAVSTSVLAVVLLFGFFAVQNVPNLSMRVAAARAGIDAGMPGYKPSGFSFKGPIQYSSGQVAITFASNTDDRSYSIMQKESNWNSDALLANYVVAENKQYQTYIDRGRTLYIYDGSNATWVDNGIWYQVEGNSDMTTDQLVRIAASI